MGFEQATIRVVKEREFADLKIVIERVFGGEPVPRYLKALSSRKVSIRKFDSVLSGNALDEVAGNQAGTAAALYGSLPVSDQAQIREFYLSKIEDVDPALRAKYHKLYQYY